MKRLKATVLVTLMAALLLPSPVQAANENTVQVELRAEKLVELVNEKGETVTERQEVKRALPGETVIYTFTYTNTGAEPVTNFTLTNAVPEGTDYIPFSAFGEGATVTFSVDGGQSYDSPGNLSVKTPEGFSRTASAEDYTHIRWQIPGPTAPGEKGEAGFRVKIDD